MSHNTEMAGEACLARTDVGRRTLLALADTNIDAFLRQRDYAARHNGRSAWDDGNLAATYAAGEFVQRRGVDFMTSVARGKPDVRPLPAWASLAIEEEIEIREKRWTGATAGTRSPEYHWYVFLTTRDQVARTEFRSTLPSAKDKLYFDILERDAMSYHARLLAFRDPNGDGERNRLKVASALESSIGADPTFEELTDVGRALAYRESTARMGRQIADARHRARSEPKPGRPEGSGDPVRHAFYLGILTEFLMKAYPTASARDVAEIAIVRGYANSTDVEREAGTWKKWIAAHDDDWEFAWLRAHVEDLRTGEVNLDVP